MYTYIYRIRIRIRTTKPTEKRAAWPKPEQRTAWWHDACLEGANKGSLEGHEPPGKARDMEVVFHTPPSGRP